MPLSGGDGGGYNYDDVQLRRNAIFIKKKYLMQSAKLLIVLLDVYKEDATRWENTLTLYRTELW